jgi:hypothetical protein
VVRHASPDSRTKRHRCGVSFVHNYKCGRNIQGRIGASQTCTFLREKNPSAYNDVPVTRDVRVAGENDHIQISRWSNKWPPPGRFGFPNVLRSDVGMPNRPSMEMHLSSLRKRLC